MQMDWIDRVRAYTFTKAIMNSTHLQQQHHYATSSGSGGSRSSSSNALGGVDAISGGTLAASSATVTTDENSENEKPPVDFQVASDSEDTDSENFDQLMLTTSPSSHSGVFLADQVRCPLCERWKKKFVCRECLLKGDFCLSNPNKIPPPVLLMEGTSKASNVNVEWKTLR
ncbi:unnamed protein product [Orchesella dallaii]|uniref:Uncharacterized protein n=1 Tax=Orchesella dallaii TaxID=48710 RepID=A0ABP1PWR0_9HEXA